MQCGAFVTDDVDVVSVAFLTLVKKMVVTTRILHVFYKNFGFQMLNEFL